MLTAGLLVLFLVGVWAAWSFSVDDSFITYRYSRHLAHGAGPVWNTTGPRVEGFTDFAWMMWNALGSTLGVALPMWSKLTSLLCGTATLLLLVRTAWRRSGVGAAAVAGGCYVVFLPTFFHITGGLETAAFATVLLRVAVVGLDILDRRRVRPWEPPALLLLAGMLRPEGVLAAAPVLAVGLWRHRRMRRVWLWFGAAVLIGAAYFLWRWHYYGQLLPNTFYVKFGNLDAGWAWTLHTGKLVLPLAALTLLLLARTPTRPAGGLLAATVACTYCTYAVSGPTMDYLDRFADHAFPVLCLGAGLGAAAFNSRWPAAITGTVAIGWSAYVGATAPDLAAIANYGPDLHRAHIPIGRGLAQAHVPPPARTLAVSDAGAIPYYSDWRSIDYIGLNSRAIAHGSDPTRLVVQAHPTVIVLTASSPAIDPVKYGLNTATATNGYRRAAAVQMHDGYWQILYTIPHYLTTVRTAVNSQVVSAAARHDPGQPADTLQRWINRLEQQLPF